MATLLEINLINNWSSYIHLKVRLFDDLVKLFQGITYILHLPERSWKQNVRFCRFHPILLHFFFKNFPNARTLNYRVYLFIDPETTKKLSSLLCHSFTKRYKALRNLQWFSHPTYNYWIFKGYISICSCNYQEKGNFNLASGHLNDFSRTSSINSQN